MSADGSPYDGVLLVGFGGPEGPAEVLPFLRRVTAGRGVPDERLAQVARQYDLVGGVSPINGQNRALLAALRALFAAEGPDLPVLWGNRNSAPFLSEVLTAAAQAGHRRLLAVLTSAYPSYSGCRQYREDLAAAAPAGLTVDRVRLYADHPGFCDTVLANVRAALPGLPPGASLVFTAHAVPLGMARTAGPDGDGYVRRLREVAAWVAAAVARPWTLVWQSRSGPPTVPWLEPDVSEQLSLLAEQGAPGALLVPIGFVSDHMEVIYDLDVIALARARSLGLPAARAATVGSAPAFVRGLRDLVVERAAVERGEHPARASRLTPLHDVCPLHCCPPLVARPAAAGTPADAAGQAPTRPREG